MTNKIDENTYREILGIDFLSARILASKNLTIEEARDLIDDKELYSLENETALQSVVFRIMNAKDNSEKILVCGDYDCDGICATTILYDALRKLDIDVGFYIPNRLEEGYGLHPNTVKLAKEKGYSLLITVDNGVKAFPALTAAKDLDIEVIVTDHHHIEEEVPSDLLLHQTLMSEPFRTLSGAGIALELSRYLLQREEPYHVVLGAIASIADVMTVTHETRAIIKHGIHYLNTMRFPTIEALHPVGGNWDEERIAFQIVPKLNATGRLADKVNVNNSVRYLLMDNMSEIQHVAKQIGEVNELRKSMSQDIVSDIKENIQNKNGFYYAYGSGYHEGIVGLAAGSIASSLEAPVMILSEDETYYKGSIRSFNKVDLTTFFNGFADKFIAFGGHKAAAGLTIAKDDIDAFLNYIEMNYKEVKVDEEEEVLLTLDITQRDVKDFEVMFQTCKPFGNGFEKPKFIIEDFILVKQQSLSSGKHLKLVDDTGSEYLLFNISESDKLALQNSDIALIAEASISEFRGVKKMNFLVQKIVSRKENK